MNNGEVIYEDCNVCEDALFPILKCNIRCSFNTCLKCFKQLSRKQCPQCRHLIAGIVSQDLQDNFHFFLFRKMFYNKISKSAIKWKMVRVLILELISAVEVTDDDEVSDMLYNIKSIFNNENVLIKTFVEEQGYVETLRIFNLYN